MEFLMHKKCAKILFLHKSLFINQLEILSLVVLKKEVAALHSSYLNDKILDKTKWLTDRLNGVLRLIKHLVISWSIGRRPWSYCYGVVSVVRASIYLPLRGRHCEVRVNVHLVSMGLHSVHLIGMWLGLGISRVKKSTWGLHWMKSNSTS